MGPVAFVIAMLLLLASAGAFIGALGGTDPNGRVTWGGIAIVIGVIDLGVLYIMSIAKLVQWLALK